MMGRKSILVPAEDVIEEAIRMFLQYYRRRRSKGHGRNGGG
jgi:hypothetical protein